MTEAVKGDGLVQYGELLPPRGQQQTDLRASHPFLVICVEYLNQESRRGKRLLRTAEVEFAQGLRIAKFTAHIKHVSISVKHSIKKKRKLKGFQTFTSEQFFNI